jgi:hypothetical protein
MSRRIRIVLAITASLTAGHAGALPNHASQHSQDSQHQTTREATAATKPEFLLQARKDLAEAETALLGEQQALEQLRRDEAKLRQEAIVKSGSWIEPAELWKKKQELKQAIEVKQRALANAKRRLIRAENEARSMTEGNWTRRHPPSWFRSWWQW